MRNCYFDDQKGENWTTRVGQAWTSIVLQGLRHPKFLRVLIHTRGEEICEIIIYFQFLYQIRNGTAMLKLHKFNFLWRSYSFHSSSLHKLFIQSEMHRCSLSQIRTKPFPAQQKRVFHSSGNLSPAKPNPISTLNNPTRSKLFLSISVHRQNPWVPTLFTF